MKQKIELEIEVPDGKKAVWKDGQIIFEDIELPKTWEEFCEQNKVKNGEYFLSGDSGILASGKGERYKDTDKNVLPSKQAAEQHLALMQLHQLRDCYRQGWNPSYLYDEQKYFISNATGFIEIDCTNRRVPFLSFPTRELAEQFLKNFEDLIKQAGDLI